MNSANAPHHRLCGILAGSQEPVRLMADQNNFEAPRQLAPRALGCVDDGNLAGFRRLFGKSQACSVTQRSAYGFRGMPQGSGPAGEILVEINDFQPQVLRRETSFRLRHTLFHEFAQYFAIIHRGYP